MYLNDPDELSLPPVLEQMIEEEEPRPPEDFFWDDVPHSLYDRHLPFHQGIHVDACRFNDKGEHVHMAKNCPHYDTEDEEGRRIQQCWTVQSMR